MDPSQVLNIINFIKCRSEPSLVVESNNHAEPLAIVLFESAKLYKMLNESNDLDAIVEQISIKNQAAKRYFSATGNHWLF